MTQAQIEIPDATRLVRLQRRLDCQPYRAYRAWSSPDALTTWVSRCDRGLARPGAKRTLVFPSQPARWDVLEAEPESHFQFRWPRLADDSSVTTVTVTGTARGYGSLVTLEDGPFDVAQPSLLDAYAESLEGGAEALANLRAVVDFSVDLR
jgi:uncharacterized protein YndB with AHSA1/START domain